MKTRRYLQAVLFGLAALFLAGCKHPATHPEPVSTGYVFDQPTPVLQKLGIARSTSARLGMRVSGQVYLPVVYGKQNRFGFFMSPNEGDTFMGPVPISAPDGNVVAHGEASPMFALGTTQLYVLWQQEDGHGTHLLTARSLTWGHSFDKPVNVVTKNKPSFNGYGSIGVAPDGDVYVVWLDGRDPQPPVPDSLDPMG
ncbi:MAG: hypothetical protein ABI076_01110, partial [Acidobacteriaceae bacterium]